MLEDQRNLKVVEQKVYEIIKLNLDIKILADLNINTELSSIGYDSIKFIKMVLALEAEFDFEFDDEMLRITAFPTINSIVKYVEEKTISGQTQTD